MRSAIQLGVQCVGLIATALLLCGCASNQKSGPTEAQKHFAAGQEEAFAMLERSGIPIIRVVGPFQRPVVQWQPDMTLSEVILVAGYLDDRDPRQILIQRGPTALPVDPATLLRGEDVPVESGDVVQVLP